MSERSATIFDKVLIANRGEIARRILRTVHAMGLGSVAVYTEADREAPHVREADEAVRLHGPGVDPYLDADALIDAARRTGAQAVHPGYGFLSENAAFARQVREAGLVFVGPSPEAMAAMGDKVAAKRIARSAGVPTLDGFALAGLDRDTVHARAAALGFPLLLKAAAGGGGKGMRRVDTADDLDAAMTSAAREAEAAFGDGSLLAERWLHPARHVEVQIAADRHGQVVHLFERDCSLQRRHQKVIEEAPAPGVDDALRVRLGAAAVALARAVDYEGVGTVEMLVADDGAFAFLEMNTRLQVEHPVTEAITGIDLVRWQLEIAQGVPLARDEDQLAFDGHAIEARLYAEDPARDFLPASGTVTLWSVPTLPGVRIDAGVEAGTVVGVDFDPLLAKVVAHGRDRREASRRLRRALDALAVGGLTTNRDFLRTVLGHPAFVAGEVHTGFLQQHGAELDVEAAPRTVRVHHAVALTVARWQARQQASRPWPPGIPSGWRAQPDARQVERYDDRGETITVRYAAVDAALNLSVTVGDEAETSQHVARLIAIDDSHSTLPSESETTWMPRGGVRRRSAGGPAELAPRKALRQVLGPSSIRHGRQRLGEFRPAKVIVEIDDVRRRFALGYAVDAHGDERWAIHGLDAITHLDVVPRFPRPATATVAGGCAAPMTGKVVTVDVAVGDTVEVGATLVVLEAMKMEHRLEAGEAGEVVAVHVEPGQMVDPDEVLVVVSPHEEDGAS